MINFNERLLDIQLKMKEKSRLEGLLNRISSQRDELSTKKNDLLSKLQREELDVEKLHGISLTHLLHILRGDSSEALDKENREFYAAKLKYDEACSELSNLQREALNLQNQLAILRNLEKEYSELLIEKETYLSSNNSPFQNQLEQINYKILNFKAEEKEIGEALSAGSSLKSALDSAYDNLSSAANWGLYDMFGGGIISTSIKHSRIDEAKDSIETAQSLLRKFHRELQDINYSANLNLDIGSFLTFADYFFDGLFADWSVQNKINDAKDQVSDIIYKVDYLMDSLKQNINNVNNNLEKLHQEKKELVEKA